MTKNDTTRTFAAIVCTLVMSATCLFGALAPAQGVSNKPVAAERLVA